MRLLVPARWTALLRPLGLLLPLALLACAPFAPARRSMAPEGLPSAYSEAAPEPAERANGLAAPVTDFWWRTLGSPELDRLMGKALDANFDVAVARARLMQLEAEARKAGASRLPSLNLTAETAHQRRSVQASESAPRLENTAESFAVGLAVSYEVDLWGRLAATREAARLRFEAGREDLAAAAMSVAASVADTWASLAGTRAEMAVLDAQIATNGDLLRLLITRYANARSSGLDVLQQQETLLAAEAEKPTLERDAAQLRHSLAVLAGGFPGDLPADIAPRLPDLPPPPAPGLPVELLDNRPDVRAAWNTLLAADQQASAAEADRLPALRLAARAGYDTPDRSLLFSNWLTSLAASLTAPLFDGGALAAEADRVRAVMRERVSQYGKVVAVAVREVEDALTGEARQRERVARLTEQLAIARVAQAEARVSYLGGRDTFLRYMTQLQNVQSLERRVVREQTALVRARIALFRALGGGWTRAVVHPTAQEVAERP